MFNIISGLLFLILGLFMTIRYRSVARMTVKFYKRIHIFHPPEQVFRVLFLLIGIMFVIVGFFELIQIIRFE